MAQPCDYDDAVLLEYLLGAAPSELRNQIERSPACRAAAEALAARLSKLYRWECPTEQLLVAYSERRIDDATLDLMLHAHIRSCPLCREELAVLAAIDELPLWPQPPALRRVIAAVYRAPLARPQPLRGDMLHYDAGPWSVQLRIRREIDRAGRWTVRGQLRTADGALADAVQAVHAYPAAQHQAPAAQPVPGSVEPGGAWRLSDLEAGSYRIAIDTPDQRIEIAELIVGTA